MAIDERNGRLWTFIFLFIVCVPRFSGAATEYCNAGDRASLLEFKEGLSDDAGLLASWNVTSVDCCQWFGVTCSSAGRVKELILFGSLRGSISSSLGNLTSLACLVLSSTNLTGPIPSSVGNLSALTYLDLSHNQLTGSLLWLSQLRALNHLSLQDNGLSGNVPAEIDDMEALRFLALSENKLAGEIPKSIGRLSNLTMLDLSGNNLQGIIPAELGNLTAGTQVYISDNFLSGNIPPELGKISSLVLLIDSNLLSGPIPDTFQNLSQISASGNFLTGVFPLSLAGVHRVNLSHNNLSSFEQVGSLPEIRRLSDLVLADNFLEGGIPEWLANCTGLSRLDLSNNELEGVIPASLLNISSLNTLNLSSNNFSSELPSSVNSKLQYLYLHQNHFQGVISSNFISSFISLYALDLGSNNLSGSIPSSLANLSDLSYLDLSQNNLTGSIPSFGVLSISILDLSYNRLTGSLTETLNKTSASYLHHLKLGDNLIGGEIPDIFGSCDFLELACFRNNRLQGSLPASLQNCSKLAVLDVGSNELNGGLPSWLNNLAPSLRILMLDSNNFDGLLPAWLSNFTNLQVLDFSNNEFAGPIPPSLNQLKGLLQPGQPVSGGTLYQDELIINGREDTYVLAATTYLDLSGNELSGDIPPQLGELQGLLFLNLSHNNLSGVIPQAFANLTSLERLDLSSNQLNGTIPSQMAIDLTFLSFLNVSSNLLSGSIPTGTQFSSFSALSFTNNPALCGPPLSILCPFDQGELASSTLSLGHESSMEDWVSFRAFGVGVAISFSVLSSFLLPYAYASGKKASVEGTVSTRREQYGVFKDPS